MDIFGFVIDTETLEIFKHLLVATFLAMLLGAERVFAHKVAGMRTYALVSLGSALFVVVSTSVTEQFIGISNFDPLRVAAQVVAGIGFLGAGIIIFRDNKQLEGLTTAAGLWVAAGIGIASGFGLYAIAVFSTLVTLFVFSVVLLLEARLKKLSGKWDGDEI